MKPTICFLLLIFSAGAGIERLPNWNFYYNKKLVLAGNSQGGVSIPDATIHVDENSAGEIIATFNYDVKSTFNSHLDVKDGEETLMSLDYTSNPSGIGAAPTVKNGSVFIISLKDVLVQSQKDSLAVDFYYSDDHLSNEHVGTICVVRRVNY